MWLFSLIRTVDLCQIQHSLVRVYPLLLICLLSFSSALAEKNESPLPEDFVYAKDHIPDLQVDLKYFTGSNFVGARVNGYNAHKLIMTEPTAKALGKVQDELKQFGLTLKVFDAYRPQMAVDHFVEWAADLKDLRTKNAFFPKVPKSELFKQGYIAEKSSHTRGSAVDLTIADGKYPFRELDMGSRYDFFDPISWPSDKSITAAQRANRMLLQKLMVKHGFRTYDHEWWHFNLKDEPFPETYFDFPVE